MMVFDAPLAAIPFLIFIGFLLGIFVTWIVMRLRFALASKSLRVDALLRSKSVLRGLVNEQFAPYLPGFPFKPTEVKFLGKPVDFIAFPGLDDGVVEEIVLVEAKSGTARENKSQMSIEAAVKDGRVRYTTYRLPPKHI